MATITQTMNVDSVPAPLGRHWGWLVAGGIGSLVVGVILLLGWPATALWTTGLLLGINLIFTGSTRITLALVSRTALVH